MLFEPQWILLKTQMQFTEQGRCSTEIYQKLTKVRLLNLGDVPNNRQSCPNRNFS